MKRIVEASPDDHFIVWHDLEERAARDRGALPGVALVYGTQDLDQREQTIIELFRRKIPAAGGEAGDRRLGLPIPAPLPQAVFLGIGFKFNDFIQAIHRIQRFLQEKPVEIHIITAESEREFPHAQPQMAAARTPGGAHGRDHRRYRLNEQAMAKALERSIGVERIEVKGEAFTCVNTTR